MDRSKNTRLTFLIGLLLAAGTLAAFHPVFRNGFTSYDDPVYVTLNHHVTGGITWATATWAFQTGYGSTGHPLVWLSHMLDVQLIGLHPAYPEAQGTLASMFDGQGRYGDAIGFYGTGLETQPCHERKRPG